MVRGFLDRGNWWSSDKGRHCQQKGFISDVLYDKYTYMKDIRYIYIYIFVNISVYEFVYIYLYIYYMFIYTKELVTFT